MKKAFLAGGFVVIFLFCTTIAQAFESSPIGWATMSDGNAPYTITGGSDGDTVIATDETTFKGYAQSTTPYVILVPTTITMTRGSEMVNIQSNKTVIGIGSNPGINGGFNISGKSNIIIRNLNIWYEDASQGCDDPWTDGITMQSGANHIWVDHCNIFDSPDGLIDPTKQTNYITISWCKFYYTPESENTCHRNCNLVGSKDTEYADRGKLKETFHHNWWGSGCKERMPRVRFGQVHVFNNYYSNLMDGGYCQGVGEECQIRVENNYYNAVNNPWKNYSTSVQGKIGWNTGNVFSGCSTPTWAPNNYSTIFTPPYSYTLDAGSSINTIVPNGAGINKLTPSPNPMTFSVAPYAVSSTSISMTASTASCQDGVEYYFACTAGGGHDSGWQSGSSYTDSGLSPNTSYTYTVQTRNQTQTIFTGAASSSASATTLTGGDMTAPTPNPMTFATAPYAASSTSIAMVASTATDDVCDVEYYFTCTSGGGHNSGWQSGTSYTDTGLTPSTSYTYTVKARDTSSNNNETTASSPASATTNADTTPPTPNPMTFATAPHAMSSSSIAMVASTATDDNYGVEYYFTCTAGGGHDSGWQSGTSYTDTGLTPSTLYTYTVKARDTSAAHNETTASGTASATTNADTTPPAAPIGLTTTPGFVVIQLDWNSNGESDLAGYNIYRSETSGSGYVKLNSSLLSNPYYDDDSVVNNTTYFYVVTAVDIYSNESAYSGEVSATTELYGDFIVNNAVDTEDLGYLCDLWLVDDCNVTISVDLDDDCTVDFYEFSVFANNWRIVIPDTNAPAAPSGLSATGGNAKVLLDWNNNNEGDLAGYNVYRSTTSGSGYSKLNASLVGSSDYNDTSVTNGTTYYYVVTAVDTSNNESAYSGQVSATPVEPITSLLIQESTAGFCSVDGSIDNNNSGFTGTGFANTANASGNGVDWSVNILTAGTYTFTWRYANGGSSDRPGNLIINSSTVASGISFTGTGSWTSWAMTGSTNVSLTTGIKSIRLEATGGDGLGNIDYIEITGPNLTTAACQ